MRAEPYVGHERRIRFPDPESADRDGVLAIGGNLSPGVLLSAYEQGVFPWYDRDPIVWFSPDPRFVLTLDRFRVSRRFRRSVRAGAVRLTFDARFTEVIAACRTAPRRGQGGTWITREMVAAYERLHRLGHAHSVEVWDADRLIGGLYGVQTGAIFAGESMFSRVPDASKYALVALAGFAAARGAVCLDCQSETTYLGAHGARNVARRDFLDTLARAGRRECFPPSWRPIDADDAFVHGLDLDLRNRSGHAARA